MKSSLKVLISTFTDTQVLHKIAESFEKKRDYESAENLYTRIGEIDPDDEKAIRKATYFKALRDPISVNEDNLPPIDLIGDLETLRSIEINYLQHKGENQQKTKPNSAPLSEVSRKIKKRRRRKIRWPKGFDPTNPKAARERPDPERWLPKLERAKYRALAKKRGYMKKTQGTRNVDTQASRKNFQKGPSTATQATVKGSGGKYNKKRKRRR